MGLYHIQSARREKTVHRPLPQTYLKRVVQLAQRAAVQRFPSATSADRDFRDGN